MGDETDSTDNDLRHRLAALEDEVQSLRNDGGAKSTRRMMLKGGVAALGLGALATPSSAGTNQAGAIGGEGATLDLWTEDLYIVEQGSTPSAPPSGYIDIYAKTDGNFYKLESDGTESLLAGGGLSAGEDFDGQGTSDFTNLSSVSTEEAIIGPDAATRPLISQADRTVTVDPGGGGDYTSLQTALADEWHINQQHDLLINLNAGTYAEDVTIEGGSASAKAGDTQTPTLTIIGDETTPSNVVVDSLINHGDAKRIIVAGVEGRDVHPEADGATFQQTGSGVLLLRDCNFTNVNGNATRALTAYCGGIITKNSIDLGTDNYLNGIVAKNTGAFVSQCQGGLTGSVTNNAYWNQTSELFAINSQDSLSGTIKSDRAPVYEFDHLNWDAGIAAHDLNPLTTRTWQDVTASRSFDTWYQAPADREIQFVVDGEADADGTDIQLTTDINTSQTTNQVSSPRTAGTTTNDVVHTGPYTVPAGSYYQVRLFGNAGDVTMKNWSELR